MAIARSTVLGSNNGATAGTTTGSITNFTIAGSDKVLYAVVTNGEVTVLSPAPTLVWDSAGANQDMGAPIAVSTGTSNYFALYRLINPTDGVNKTLSASGLSATSRDAMIGFLYTGVDQVTPNDTIDIIENASAATLSSSTITNPAGDWILSIFSHNGSAAITATGGGNTVTITQFTNGNVTGLGVGEDADGADDTFDWSTASAQKCGAFTFNLNAAVGGGGRTTKNTRPFPLGTEIGMNWGGRV